MKINARWKVFGIEGRQGDFIERELARIVNADGNANVIYSAEETALASGIYNCTYHVRGTIPNQAFADICDFLNEFDAVVV